MKILFEFEKNPLLFKKPHAIVSCTRPSLVPDCFQKIEQALKNGYYVAGFLSYEAGQSFEPRIPDDTSRDFPLVYMGVFEKPVRKTLVSAERLSRGQLKDLRLNISKEEYFADIQTIRNFIARGEVYQITYCIKLLFSFGGDPRTLYRRLLKEQPVPYPAYLESDDFNILSLSPEMFLKKTGKHIVTKPMKGTWPRGRHPLADILARLRFQYDEKNRAENVMIADLLRNDLGRVGQRIRAPKLFKVAGYKTLFQMTSTVTGEVGPDIRVQDLFAAVFPSGSVTGTPRLRAMDIIRQLEGEERRIYTGAIGYITPDKDLFFNIPIRTLLLRNGSGEMGIGGGIVWDSTPQGEWEEGLLKSRFLTDLASR